MANFQGWVGGDSSVRNSSIKDIHLAGHIDKNKLIYRVFQNKNWSIRHEY